jgi:diaminohydroxyphosphoribosylaminopyrimidine deaminase / 5-amino-6-(5-phosphoribosylamino)uracil reductase
MSRTLQLARRGIGLVSPGALVGAVVVRRGVVVGEGYYRYDRKNHAEVIALEKAGALARGALLYVNLEPCSHYGRTPPCADLITRSGIQTVVCAMRDPNPLVTGRGFRQLRAAGIEVKVGLGEDEAVRLNEAFVRYITSRRPFVTLKTAMTIDGKIAQARQARGSVTWITSEGSRERVHEIRHAHDALLVGINTILRDDPLLTDRSGRPRRRKLLRVVLDANLRMSVHSNLVRTASKDVLIFCSLSASQRKLKTLETRGIQVIPVADRGTGTPRKQIKHLSWKSILQELGNREIQSLLIEGGGETNGSAMRAEIVDKVHFFIAPKVLGGDEHVSVFGGKGFGSLKAASRLSEITLERIAEDILITGYTRSNDEI